MFPTWIWQLGSTRIAEDQSNLDVLGVGSGQGALQNRKYGEKKLICVEIGNFFDISSTCLISPDVVFLLLSHWIISAKVFFSTSLTGITVTFRSCIADFEKTTNFFVFSCSFLTCVIKISTSKPYSPSGPLSIKHIFMFFFVGLFSE